MTDHDQIKAVQPLLEQITAAQERPKTALVELAEYCERQAKWNLHMASVTQAWRQEHQELYEQFTRWRIAAKEADEQ